MNFNHGLFKTLRNNQRVTDGQMGGKTDVLINGHLSG